MNEPRESVKWFAQEMEKKLKKNDYKGGWEDERFEFLLEKLKEETDELRKVVYRRLDIYGFASGMTPKRKREIIREAADVANIVMMIADNVKNERC